MSDRRTAGSRATRVVLALAVVATSIGTVIAAPASRPDAACSHPIDVPAVGRACPLPGGLWQVVLDDGTTVVTHGGDPVPSSTYVSRYQVLPNQVKPACVYSTSNQFHIRVIYTYASDKPDEWARELWHVRALVYLANGYLRQEAAKFNRVVNYRVACSGAEVTVSKVKLSTPDASTGFGSIVSDVRRAGFTDPLAKYWIWHDGGPRGGAAGVGTFEDDSTLRARNRNNLGPSYAVTFGLGYRQGGVGTMMHEMGHNMGAVALDAPRSSTAAHCIDGLDVMCYPDSSYGRANYRNNICWYEMFDCGYNDYFNPVPHSKNYLASHWNLADPLNRFMSGCAHFAGTIAAGVQGQQLQDHEKKPLTYRVHGIPSRCWSKKFAVSGVVSATNAASARVFNVAPECVVFCGVGHLAQTVANDALTAVSPDLDVCFYKGSKVLRCFAGSSFERSFVPYGATTARVILKQGAQAIYAFNIV